MPLILTRTEVLAIYADAARRRWVHPSFSTENVTTTEAILAAALEHSDHLRQPDFPITIALTHRYPERPQSAAYSPAGNAVMGMKLFHADLRTLTGRDSPYARLRVLVHLDHGQFDTDADALDSPGGVFSSVMFDASGLSFEDNVSATRRYVERHQDEIVVEGACDTIAHVGESGSTPCTAPDDAEHYYRATGVDWIVANLGTEHRAGVSTLRYRDDVAREIRRRIGPKLSLHGTSSVRPDQLTKLFEDGVGKANFWTALERDSSSELMTTMVEHAAECAGSTTALLLKDRGLLGPKIDASRPVSIDYCTTRFRQNIVFESMKRTVKSFLAQWCPV
jgi:fructose/tagatose bisphosphate aldolase